MSKLRSVNTHFWADNYIIDCDPIEKLLFLYLITNNNTNMLGIYELHVRKIAFDTGIDKDMVLKIFDRFHTDGKASYIDGYVCLHNFTKHQSYNSNMKTSAINSFNELPLTVRKQHFCEPLIKGLEPLPEGSEPLAKVEYELERELEEESEGESETGAPPREEEKPKLHPEADVPEKEEWEEYLLASLRYSKEFVEHLWDHLMVKGWSVGSPPEPIRDWRAYARKQNQWAYEYDQKQKELESKSKNKTNGNDRKQKGRGNDASGFLHHLAGKGSS